jgi:hypothetical protein
VPENLAGKQPGFTTGLAYANGDNRAMLVIIARKKM